MPPAARGLPAKTKPDPDAAARIEIDIDSQDAVPADDREAAKRKQHLKDADELYDFMFEEIESEEGLGVTWLKAEDLLKAPVAKGKLEALLPLINTLSNKQLIRAAKTSSGRTGETTWTCRAREDAKKVVAMTNEEKMVYSNIEDTQEKGIWVRNLKQKTGLNAAIVEKSLKKLESNRLVKGVKNVKHPMQKTYILYHIVPNDEITGGTFFDAGTLDQNMIDEISNIIVFHVHQQSWASGRARPIRRAQSAYMNDNHAQGKKRKRTVDIEDAVGQTKIKQRIVSNHRDYHEKDTVTSIAYPAGTREYPNTESIHKYIDDVAILRDKGTNMTVADLQSVIDVLVWDNKLERIGEWGYRTVRGVTAREPGATSHTDIESLGFEPGNGLTQSACWRCPVFDTCGDGGPINANTCVYFEDWLEVDG